MTAMKAVLLAAGSGSRMRAPDDSIRLSEEQCRIADAGHKALTPIGGRPFLDFAISALADAGISNVCVVLGPAHRASMARYPAALRPRRIALSFVVQPQPLGAANALLAASEFIGDDNCIVVNADNYYPPRVLASLVAAKPPALPAFDRAALLGGGQLTPERLASYALLDISGGGTLRDIVEKPDPAAMDAMKNAPVSMNCWHFTADILGACRRMPASRRGEFELPLAVHYAIHQMGLRFSTFPVAAEVLDLTRRSDIAFVEQRLRGVRVEL